VLEAAALNDLWHLEWDEEGSVDWTFVGPANLQSFVSNRGQGNTLEHFTSYEVDGDAGPAFGLWISGRSGHAAWAAADGRLFIFGGVGLTLRVTNADPDANVQMPCLSVDEGQCPCAMLSDLWTLYPHRDSDPPLDNNGATGSTLESPFMEGTGWELSQWGWRQAGRNMMGDFPDIPHLYEVWSQGQPPAVRALNLSESILRKSFGNAACMAHWKRQMPLEDWPDKNQYPPLHYNDSAPQQNPNNNAPRGPLARRAAVTWTDPDAQTGWMYGGENMFAVGNELMSDLWKFDLSIERRIEDPRAGRPVKIAEQVRTSPGKGAPDGLPMAARAHAMAWVDPRPHEGQPAGAAEAPAWPVIFGGVGERLPKTEQAPFWPEPWSTDPWTTKYLDDVWVWHARDDRSGVARPRSRA
jgi:hypothetical protein